MTVTPRAEAFGGMATMVERRYDDRAPGRGIVAGERLFGTQCP